MQTYKNDYSKKEDFVLWELHEIRNKMANDDIDISAINNNALKIIKQFKLRNLKLIKHKEVS